MIFFQIFLGIYYYLGIYYLGIYYLGLFLSIGFWNINGLSEEKSENNIYQKNINKFDIIFLLET